MSTSGRDRGARNDRAALRHRGARGCARPGCAVAATATLSYEYASRTVWLDELHPEAHPANHDLCDRHADRLRPPNGWELVDRRRNRARGDDRNAPEGGAGRRAG